MSNNSTERRLLQKAHSKERVEELMQERYSLAGKQTPILTVSSTQGTLADNRERRLKQQRKVQKRRKKTFPIKPARDALKGFISDVRSGKEPIKYSEFEPLHALWIDYIHDLLGTSENTSIITGKLASADFHGAILQVVKARNPSLVGLQGIVCWEARTSFILVTPHDVIKIVEKSGTVFRVHDHGTQRTLDIVGSRFLYRTADRSGRKFKAHRVDGLVA